MATKELTAKDLNVTPLDSPLTQDIILHRRRYFVKKVKEPLMKSLVWAFDKRTKSSKVNSILDKIALFVAVWNVMQTVNRYPEPTRERCRNPLTLALFDFWDEFFMWEHNPEHRTNPDKYPFFGRMQLWRAARRVELSEVEHDWYYRQRNHWRMDWIARAYLDGRIAPLPPIWPDRRICWKEPKDTDKMLSWLEFLAYQEGYKMEVLKK